MPVRPSFVRNALVSSALVVGITAGAAGVASAATSSSGTSTTSPSPSSGSTSYGSAPRAGTAAPANPATLSHGPNETLLTGTAKAEADASATAAEPGATIVRAETDSSGVGTYEVHMKKSDGTYVTVYLDADFKVTSTGTGFGAGPAGQSAPAGAPSAPAGAPSAPAA